MLEYFSYKKLKKHQEEKKASEGEQTKKKETKVQTPPPILNAEDEAFLERIAALSEGPPPPLPTRPTFGEEAGDHTNNASQVVVHDGREDLHKSEGKGKGKETEADGKKENKFTGFIGRTFSKRGRPDLKPKSNVSKPEAHREEDDLTTILDDLDLSASNNRAFSLSAESQELVGKFTVILKDLINGVPTAYDDLINLLDDSSGTLSKGYEKLPSSLQKMVTTLPDKLTKYIAPELLAAAAEVQGVSAATAGTAGAAGIKNFFTPSTLKNLVTKPGAVMGAFKAIMNALKLRWPAFMGTNVLLSLGLFILMFFFWYCHKRGREVRLEKESQVDSNGRIIEIVDPPLPAPSSSSTPRRRGSRSGDSRSRSRDEEDEAAMARRRARREEHERQKREKRRAEDREERGHHHSGSRPSSSRQGSSRLKAEERDRDGRRSRSSRDSRESRDSRDGREKRR